MTSDAIQGANPQDPDQRVIATTLSQLEPTMTASGLTGPALTFLGLAPRAAAEAAQDIALQEEFA